MKSRRALTYAAASGVLVALSFPDAGIWPLAWVGLVPWMLAVRGRRPGVAFGYGFVTGLVCFAIVLYWIPATVSNFTRIDPYTATFLLVLMASAVSFFHTFAPIAMVGEWLAAAGISRVIAFPLVWAVLEWARTFFVAGFPWASLGYSQHGFVPVNQLAELTGVYGISALLVFVNATIAELATGGFARHRRLVAASVTAFALVVVFGVARLATLSNDPDVGALRVGLVQGNIAQHLKWDPALQDKTIDTYLRLSEKAAADGAELIVWPEAAVPFLLLIDERQRRLTDFSDRTGTTLLVGAPGWEKREPDGVARSYNQAWLIEPGKGLSDFYDKIQLVPFGEYIPFSWLFGSIPLATESVGQFGRGDRFTVFEGPALDGAFGAGDGARRAKFGALICYEGIFPNITRRFVVDGARMLVNISNDAWYGDTSAPTQHLAMVAMRAIENRVPVIRATNTGVTALIDRTGNVRGATELFVEAVVVDDVEIRRGKGLYAWIGDAFAYLCMAGLGVLVYFRLRLGRQSRG